jgi:YHS domain-containing protein
LNTSIDAQNRKETTMKMGWMIMATTAALALGARAEEAAKDDYPLTTCVVSEEALDSMGGYYSFEYQGREVRFCCKDCKTDFLAEPAKYLKMIDDAAAAKKTKTETDSHAGHNH